jgi:hypothetical protein
VIILQYYQSSNALGMLPFPTTTSENPRWVMFDSSGRLKCRTKPKALIIYVINLILTKVY